jgi:hypothetical protein
MARHLHAQSGGDPAAQGPVPELANEPRSPRSDEDFPDAPDPDARSGVGGDLTDDQLQDFAARLGLADESGESDRSPERDESDESDESAERDRSGRTALARRTTMVAIGKLRRPAARVVVVIGRVTIAAGHRVRSVGERLTTD